MTRTTLVTIAVTGPYHRGGLPLAGRRPRWHHLRVRCDLRRRRTAAGGAAVTVLGRLEVPGGGDSSPPPSKAHGCAMASRALVWPPSPFAPTRSVAPSATRTYWPTFASAHLPRQSPSHDPHAEDHRRPAWPVLAVRRFYVRHYPATAAGRQADPSGQGENSWDCDDDAIHSSRPHFTVRRRQNPIVTSVYRGAPHGSGLAAAG